MRAIDIMTAGPTCIDPNSSVMQATEIMLNLRVSGLPVVDESGRLVGIVTEGDLLRRVELGTEKHRPRWLEFFLSPAKLSDEYVKTHGRKVSEVMTTDVVTIGEDAELAEVAELMLQHRIKRLPVVRQGHVVGIISRMDIVRALAKSLAEQTSPSFVDDVTLRQTVLTEIGRQPWMPVANIDITVHGGTVELVGALREERQRQAIHVLVENIPGVRGVNDHLIVMDMPIGL